MYFVLKYCFTTVTRKETFVFQQIYGEPPSDEVDAAWNALMPRMPLPPFTIRED